MATERKYLEEQIGRETAVLAAAGLQEQSASLEEEICKCRVRVKSLIKLKESLLVQIKRLEGEDQYLEQQIKVLGEQVVADKEELQSAEAAIASIIETEQAKRERLHRKLELQIHQEKLQKFQQSEALASVEIEAAKKLAVEHDAAMEEMEKLKQILAALKDYFEVMTDDALLQKVEDIGEAGGLEIQAMATQIKSLTQQVGQLTASLESATKEKEAFQQGVQELEQRLCIQAKKFEDAFAEKDSILDQLQKQLDQIERQKQAAVAAVQQKLTQQQEESLDLKSCIAELRDRERTKDEALKAAQEAAAAAKIQPFSPVARRPLSPSRSSVEKEQLAAAESLALKEKIKELEEQVSKFKDLSQANEDLRIRAGALEDELAQKRRDYDAVIAAQAAERVRAEQEREIELRRGFAQESEKREAQLKQEFEETKKLSLQAAEEKSKRDQGELERIKEEALAAKIEMAELRKQLAEARTRADAEHAAKERAEQSTVAEHAAALLAQQNAEEARLAAVAARGAAERERDEAHRLQEVAEARVRDIEGRLAAAVAAQVAEHAAKERAEQATVAEHAELLLAEGRARDAVAQRGAALLAQQNAEAAQRQSGLDLVAAQRARHDAEEAQAAAVAAQVAEHAALLLAEGRVRDAEVQRAAAEARARELEGRLAALAEQRQAIVVQQQQQLADIPRLQAAAAQNAEAQRKLAIVMSSHAIVGMLKGLL